MEDFDIFTNKIEFTKSLLKNTLNKLVYDHRSTPNGPNYESAQKLLAEECLVEGEEEGCAFHLSEAVASTVRTITLYREEQLQAAGDKLYKITPYLKPITELTSSHPVSKSEENILEMFDKDRRESSETLNMLTAEVEEEEVPFHKQYLRFSRHNNVDNFQRILKELPEEWTIVQLSAVYDGRENTAAGAGAGAEHRTDVGALLVTVLAGDHVDRPFTVHVPANVTREGEKPLLKELHSILEENYRTIDNAHSLNNRRLVQNYWARREDIDLRMKSVLQAMEERWLGGWGCLLAGRAALAADLAAAVDAFLADWGLTQLTEKQRKLLYKVVSGAGAGAVPARVEGALLARVLLEHGDLARRRDLLVPCARCSTDFRSVSEGCGACLAACFERVHGVAVGPCVRALRTLLGEVREGDRWAPLRRATRQPLILIVDEILDSFPWESLPGLRMQPTSRVDSVHSLYHLYKRHEARVVRGHYLTTAERGRYVINPERNLDRMEKRMSSFVQYWCGGGGWEGVSGAAPAPAAFLEYLRGDVFLYCGHGDGCALGAGAGVDGASGARAVCLLAGCGSARLHAAPPRRPPQAAHRRLHVAGCPTVVGMLWEVTDLEVDKVVTTLVSLCVPSTAPRPWHDVGKADWSRGILVVEPAGAGAREERAPASEPRLLRAVCRARPHSAYLMIAASLVVRGLPVEVVLPGTYHV